MARKNLLTRQQRARSCWVSSSAMCVASSRMSNTFSHGVVGCMNVEEERECGWSEVGWVEVNECVCG